MGSTRDRASIFPTAMWLATLALLVGDGLVGYGLFRQGRTARFAEGKGTITRSTIQESSDGDGTSYAFQVAYTYAVDGQHYLGTLRTHALFDGPSGSYSAARALEERYPLEAPVTVYYDPDAPGQAVLERGLGGSDLHLPLLLLSLHVLLLSGWRAVVHQRQGPRVRSFVVGNRTHVPMVESGTRETGLQALAVASFLAWMLTSLPVFQSSLHLMPWVWGAVLLVGGVAALKHQRKQARGLFDLIVNDAQGRLSLPPMFGRARRLELAMSQVRSVTVVQHLEEKGDDEPLKTWRPTLTFLSQGIDQRVVLAEWTREDHAEALRDWLKARLKGGVV